MAGTPDVWTAAVSYTQNLGAGLTRLGRYAVPREVRMRFAGDKDLPEGKRWPDATFRFEVRDGAAVCTEIRIVSEPGDRPIRTNDLLVFNLDALAEEVFTAFAMKPTGEPGGWTRTASEPNEEAWGDVHAAVEASYELDPQAELLDVARVYLSAGARSKPTDSVMDALGYGSRSTASRKVKAARAAGLIPPPGASAHELDEALRQVNARIAKRSEATQRDNDRKTREEAARLDPESARQAKADAFFRRQARREAKSDG